MCPLVRCWCLAMRCTPSVHHQACGWTRQRFPAIQCSPCMQERSQQQSLTQWKRLTCFDHSSVSSFFSIFNPSCLSLLWELIIPQSPQQMWATVGIGIDIVTMEGLWLVNASSTCCSHWHRIGSAARKWEQVEMKHRHALSTQAKAIVLQWTPAVGDSGIGLENRDLCSPLELNWSLNNSSIGNFWWQFWQHQWSKDQCN